MNTYVISTSFDMNNKGAWIMTDKAESAEDMAKRELIDGYEMFVPPTMDIVFVKYQKVGVTYMIFRIA